MTMTEFNRTAIEEIGPTEPTYNARPEILVRENKEWVFEEVARAVSALKEIEQGYLIGEPEYGVRLHHSVTGQPLTKEWLFEYLAKAIDFRYWPRDEDGHNKKDGQVPEWLPRMIMERSEKFIVKMWF